MMEEEIWRPIQCFEDWYEVSNLAHVRSVSHMTVRQYKDPFKSDIVIYPSNYLHPSKTKTGHLKVNLRKGKQKTSLSLARLVALHFLNNYSSGCKIEFIDGNKENCTASNLRCV